ncbi:hypothetical protein Taro_033680 [Colocasia esculenta]|uniref:Uncharacterized protein n=1 Tax=Colocasia esculenta TaxID=4460 RepID=A0A843W9P2_COLES|nr:hypothetical protein [Colocasia esculenta]
MQTQQGKKASSWEALTKWLLAFSQERERRWRATQGEGVTSSTAAVRWCSRSDGGWCAATGTTRSWAGAVQMLRRGDDGAALSRAQWGERRSSDDVGSKQAVTARRRVATTSGTAHACGQTLEQPNMGVDMRVGRGGAEHIRPNGRMASASTGERAGQPSWRQECTSGGSTRTTAHSSGSSTQTRGDQKRGSKGGYSRGRTMRGANNAGGNCRQLNDGLWGGLLQVLLL